ARSRSASGICSRSPRDERPGRCEAKAKKGPQTRACGLVVSGGRTGGRSPGSAMVRSAGLHALAARLRRVRLAHALGLGIAFGHFVRRRCLRGLRLQALVDEILAVLAFELLFAGLRLAVG